MNTLLIIIDQPEKSRDFIKYTVNMAKDLEVNVQILHTENPDLYPFGTPGTTGTATAQLLSNLESMAEEVAEKIKKYVDEARSQVSGKISIDISAEISSLRSSVDKYISENKANMVVLKGQEGDSSLSPDNTMDIIQFFDCPVWIIPHNASYQPYNEIVYATDYNEEDISTLKRLIALTGRFSPKITALHITENLDFKEKIKKAGFLETIHRKTSYAKIGIISMVAQKDEDIAQLVNDFASTNGANLIVVLKENRHFLERIFKTSSTKKIIRQSHLPVLVYHERS